MPEMHDDPVGDNSNQASRRSSGSDKDSESNGAQNGETQAQSQQDLPKAKRMACVLCRKRKLRCDGNRPSCATCIRLQHDCVYDEVRRKSGPRRGYVKKLEARLAQVESLLKTQDEPVVATSTAPEPTSTAMSTAEFNFNAAKAAAGFNVMAGIDTSAANTQIPMVEEPFPWEMIGLGLDEPLPTNDVVQDLNTMYFDKAHPCLPMIHRPRYYAAMNLAPHMRPPVCLRYAMWCLAASMSDKYSGLQEHFYQRARKYIQLDEMKGHGEPMVTIAHCQTWILLATYEFKMMYFPRAWMSAGRASRMALMMGVHRLDGQGLDVKQCLSPPRDWTEREERRRTFWAAFSIDRYSSIGTGWPMAIDERDIMSCLPSDEEAFENSREPALSITLEQALQIGGAPNLAPFSGSVVMACLFGRNLTHLHRPGQDENDHDLNGGFWRRHMQIDNVLANLAMCLPERLRFPAGAGNPNVIFLNMCIHTSTICLHQAAIFKADKNNMAAEVGMESKKRCITAATETAKIMRQVAHMDLSTMNPFVSFSLYVAARVFVQYLRARPRDSLIRSSLQFLLAAMHAFKRHNPLTESFLIQLDVDLEGAGLEGSNDLRAQMPAVNRPNLAADGCGVEQLSRSANMNVNLGEEFSRSANMTVEELNGGPKTFGITNAASMGSSPSFELPNRQRTPVSVSLSNSNNTTTNRIHEMDLSPDGSGQTPTSLPNLSSHTSNTGYSPQTGQDLQPNENSQTNGNGLYSNVGIMFNGTNSFDTGNYSQETQQQQNQQHERFILPPEMMKSLNYSSSSTGLSPNNLPMTPGLGYGDFSMNWDSENLDFFSTDGTSTANGAWDTGMPFDAGYHDLVETSYFSSKR